MCVCVSDHIALVKITGSSTRKAAGVAPAPAARAGGPPGVFVNAFFRLTSFPIAKLARHQNFVSLVLFAKVAREVLSDGTGLTLACVLRFEI